MIRLLPVAAAAALATVAGAGSAGLRVASAERAPLGGLVRRVYVEARMEEWDYFPGGFDFVNGVPGSANPHARHLTEFDPPSFMGSRFLKLRYRRYRDAAFSEPWPESPELGILGFLIHAEVGDRILLTLRNGAHVPVSAHPHGLQYTKGNEGLPSGGQAPGERMDDAVAPGAEFTYEWDAAERSGPADGDGISSLGWLVHSHVDEAADVAAGLVGFVAVTRRGWARPDGSPRDVDREVAVLWTIQNEAVSRVRRESVSWALAGRPAGDVAAAAAAVGVNSSAAVDAALSAETMGLMQHSVNGRLFGTLGGLSFRRGERVRWYNAALGDDRDVHTAHWHGATVVQRGARLDTLTMLPATHATADMVPDICGTFLLHCHVDHHMRMGMAANWTVLPCVADPCPPSDGTMAFEELRSRATPLPAADSPWLYAAAGAVTMLFVILIAVAAVYGAASRCRGRGYAAVSSEDAADTEDSGRATDSPHEGL